MRKVTRKQLAKRVELALLRRSALALTDWVRSYAPELCTSAALKESSTRVYQAGGTLAYIAALRKDINAALAAHDRKGKR